MLSVVIIAKNEESRIKACLESIKWADEIIFFDNGSTDKTREIAGKYTDKIFDFKELDYADVKNKAFDKTSGDWVLYLDGDERVLNSLKEEIEGIIKGDDNSAYAISRKNIIFGQETKYGPFWPDWIIRLVKREAFKGWVGSVHETLTFSGNLGYTKNSMLHLTHRDLDQVVLKSLNWSNIDAKLRLDSNHPKMSSWRFLRILFSELFYQGVIRKGFFNGSVGTIDSILQSFSLFMTYVRLWQLQQVKSMDQTYNDIDKKLIEDGFKYS
jgi:hypothetical protein